MLIPNGKLDGKFGKKILSYKLNIAEISNQKNKRMKKM